MTYIRLITALMGATLVFAAAGCAPGGDVDFWGNPIESAEPDTCDLGTVAAPPPYDPATDQRPPDITPGFSWLAFEIIVRAVSAGGDVHFCVPFEAYAYTRSGEADTLTLNRAGLPADGISWRDTTPMVGKYLALQYDPSEERFAGRPPEYEVHISATYTREHDHLNTVEQNPYMMLTCTIAIAGAPVHREIAFISSADEGGTASCTLISNSGWRTY